MYTIQLGNLTSFIPKTFHKFFEHFFSCFIPKTFHKFFENSFSCFIPTNFSQINENRHLHLRGPLWPWFLWRRDRSRHWQWAMRGQAFFFFWGGVHSGCLALLPNRHASKSFFSVINQPWSRQLIHIIYILGENIPNSLHFHPLKVFLRVTLFEEIPITGSVICVHTNNISPPGRFGRVTFSGWIIAGFQLRQESQSFSMVGYHGAHPLQSDCPSVSCQLKLESWLMKRHISHWDVDGKQASADIFWSFSRTGDISITWQQTWSSSESVPSSSQPLVLGYNRQYIYSKLLYISVWHLQISIMAARVFVFVALVSPAFGQTKDIKLPGSNSPDTKVPTIKYVIDLKILPRYSQLGTALLMAAS